MKYTVVTKHKKEIKHHKKYMDDHNKTKISLIASYFHFDTKLK